MNSAAGRGMSCYDPARYPMPLPHRAICLLTVLSACTLVNSFGEVSQTNTCDKTACPGQDSDCQQRNCDDGKCGVTLVAAGTTCDEDGGAVCDGQGSCVLSSLGQSCEEPGQCATANCVDGVCCDSVCEGTCRACSGVAGGDDGVCTMAPYGTDPEVE